MIYPRVSLFAAMLAMAGIPLYIHLPRFASVELGITLAALGPLLLLIRVVDLVQDPAIGWAIDRWPNAQNLFAMLAAAGLAIGFPLLFTLQSGPYLVVKLVGVLVLLFSAYSLGMILLYGRSATLAVRPERENLITLAAFREAGMLTGVIVAAAAPSVLVTMGAADQGYRAYGLFLGALAVGLWVVTMPMWRRPPVAGEHVTVAGLADAGALRLLALALVNSLPVAITSTLFVFFVEDRLLLEGMAGPLLILFFLSAAASVPVWTKASLRFGAKAVLLLAMPLAILSFVGAAALAPGNLAGFAIVCLMSGAALGADMVLLPAMFSVALNNAGLNASLAFGIWSFAGKLALALAAFTMLPLLDFSGFVPGKSNSVQALTALTVAYAVIPCGLKLGALALVWSLPSKEPSV
ncbi:MFS transporter [Shimia sp. Alg240-R146]|uniref:MFS transporter n=1 Tax=Shimia sp. Alg240-R146 TaxID=2993449 RepID=UPI0022E4650C|nr:MFS transporter [Shimia sp. Alg240-R146]